MKHILIVFCLIFSAISMADDSTFSEWMPIDGLKSYIEINKSVKFPDGKYMIYAIQGRYRQGKNEYRVVLAHKKDDVSRWWWWYSQDIDSFTAKVAEYENKGAILYWAQSFTGHSGNIYYQAVWVDYK